MNGKKKVETTPVNEEKTTKKTTKDTVEKEPELTLGDKPEPEPYSLKQVPANEDSVIKRPEPLKQPAVKKEDSVSAFPKDLEDPIKEAAHFKGNVTLILRCENDVSRARECYDHHRPKKHTGNLDGIRVNERQTVRVLWRAK